MANLSVESQGGKSKIVEPREDRKKKQHRQPEKENEQRESIQKVKEKER